MAFIGIHRLFSAFSSAFIGIFNRLPVAGGQQRSASSRRGRLAGDGALFRFVAKRCEMLRFVVLGAAGAAAAVAQKSMGFVGSPRLSWTFKTFMDFHVLFGAFRGAKVCICRGQRWAFRGFDGLSWTVRAPAAAAQGVGGGQQRSALVSIGSASVRAGHVTVCHGLSLPVGEHLEEPHGFRRGAEEQGFATTLA